MSVFNDHYFAKTLTRTLKKIKKAYTTLQQTTNKKENLYHDVCIMFHVLDIDFFEVNETRPDDKTT